MHNSFIHNGLPEQLNPLVELALNLRWTWSHNTDVLWKSLNAELWELTQNPLLILNDVSPAQLERVSQDPQFKKNLDRSIASLRTYLEDPGWYGQTYNEHGPKCIAYFSMEFGIGNALPLYAGGLGMLAGDHLKTASDLGVPIVGVGLMYFQGYVRQMLSADEWQLEFFPHNDSANLPIVPVRDTNGSLLQVPVELPGRNLMLRVWRAQVGNIILYLLDSNDLYNSPADQGITSRLYHETPEIRLLQEIVLGIGGWRVLSALGIEPEVCHLNEGHAAFVALERARHFKHDNKLSFQQALWATRAGNVFTTHTPVAAAFDQFDKELIAQYFSLYVQDLDISMEELLALGDKDMGQQTNENSNTFNMAYLALHSSGHINGVSKLHGEVSRNLFTGLFPSWPPQEVPVTHITNGVHVPSWDSQWADVLWTDSCGKQRWLGALEENAQAIAALSDEAIWDCRAKGRNSLVNYARKRLARQLGQHGATPEVLEQAKHVLDPNVLTLGFARRFTAYKRPNLLFHDQERLAHLLADVEHPVQLIVAGKTHPQDVEGKRLLQAVARFSKREDVKQRVVFLERLEHFLIRVPGGCSLTERFLAFQSRTATQVFWVNSVSDPAWKLLTTSEPHAAGLVQIRHLEPPDRKTLEELLLIRHSRSGVPLEFVEPMDLNPLVRRKLKRARTDKDRQDVLRSDYFDWIFRASQGNVLMAILMWLRSADFTSRPGWLRLKPSKAIRFAFLEEMDLPTSFALKAFLEHESLTLGEYCRVFAVPYDEGFQALEVLRRKVLIDRLDTPGGLPVPVRRLEDEVRYRIPPIITQVIAQNLGEQNILH
jgi:alpha-glucan phosphorylase-like protein